MLTRINDTLLRVWARLHEEKGQALAEYGLILALIAVVCILALTALGLGVSGKLGDIASAITGGS